MDRRDFISKTILGTGSILTSKVVFAEHFPKNYNPVEGELVPGKSNALIIHNNRPWNAETPAHLLDPEVTPAEVFFVRNNGIPPFVKDVAAWKLTIGGESVHREITFSLAELKANFKHYSCHLTLECGGNGRAEFNPPAKGNQWGVGAVGCCKWTGVRLKDVLENVGIKSDAVYIGYYGADVHLSGETDKVVISRGVPIKKALENETLLAWSMNDGDIPAMNGYPLRLVVGGWPASCSGKWLTRIDVRNKVHDGAKMEGSSYRMPKHSVAPGTKVSEDDMEIIESMPVKSIITFPKSGAMVEKDRIELRGHAWAGDLTVKEMWVSINFGATWQKANLKLPINRLAWQRWTAEVELPELGYYEIWARAVDSLGNAQPMVVPGWNPKGYLNNACHRIAIKRLA